MKKKHTHNETICIKIPIKTDKELRKFILDNAFMRNKIRNDFIEEAIKYKGEYNMYYDFKPLNFKTEYFNEIEVPENRYNYYCVGLSERVANDINIAKKIIQRGNSKILQKRRKSSTKNKLSLGEFKFKKFDYNRYSFRVRLKPTIGPNGNIRSRLSILNSREIVFVIRSNKYHRDAESIHVKLNEDLYDDLKHKDNNINPTYIRYYNTNSIINKCKFMLDDIKDISFMHECGKYYIILFINVEYKVNKLYKQRRKGLICGIDTGIRHPVTLYDGISKPKYLSMDDNTVRKIHYLERRIKRLSYYKDIKWQYNFDHGLSTHSNNIIKMCKKIRKLYKKITDIKIHWIRNRCKEITTLYETIVVDTYECPNANDDDSLPKIVQRRINYANRFHKMFYFNEFLKHDCIKYGCNYVVSPEDTTRTCSVCGYVNDHLSLSDINLCCKSCGTIIERDINAARNCYYYALA